MSRDDYVRVSARVRNTRAKDEKVVFADESTGSISFRINGEEKRFTFDNVFSETSSQEGVFVQVGKRIIDGCLAGYNGTIFAYGQTGSGKTYTMFGPQDEDGSFKKSLQGIIPRSMDYLFEKLNSEHQEDPQRFSFSVHCSFVQLYNESLFCLLDKSEKSLRIRTNAMNEVVVEGAVVEQVTSCDEVFEILRIGFKNRRVAETCMNRESSRSHAIFMVDIRTQHVADGVINSRSARLNLVDLAGSERQSDSQATGSQLKEATYINKSLSTLTRVIRSLSKKPKEYPGYRDSSLTRLLQDSLGGNTRSSVIINLHPTIQFTETTASTLYFSDTVKRIKNNATVNENIAGGNVDALKNEILRLKAQIDDLKCSTMQVKTLEDELRDVKATLAEKVEHIAQLEHCVENQEVYLALKRQNNKLEKQVENYKKMVEKRDESICQFEADLAYKARRIENYREVLDKMYQKNVALEEEHEALKQDKLHCELEKAEMEKKATTNFNAQISQLRAKLAEAEKQRDALLKQLAELAGHANTKQKINYVSKLRERISLLEKENSILKSSEISMRSSLTDISKTKENISKPKATFCRPVLRPRGNSQPSRHRSALSASDAAVNTKKSTIK